MQRSNSENLMVTLYPFQQFAIDGIKASLRSGHRRPVLSMPTGAGKTLVAAGIIEGARAKGNSVAFCVPLLSLVDQTLSRLTENGIDQMDIGVIQGAHELHRPDAPIQIASIQTLARRSLPTTSLVIIDEAHVRYKVIDDWMAAEPKKVFIAMTATPWARGMAEQWDDLIAPVTIKELIEQGYLCPFKAFSPSHPDLSGLKVVAGDYQESQLSERMSQKSIVADVVQTWLAKAERRPTLVFAVDLAHAALLHQQFADEGVSSSYVDAETDRQERVAIGKRLNNGALEVIVSVGTMTHGVDLDVRCIVLARPTKSEILYVQMVGRGLRTAAGKDHCLLLDHSDSTLNLGLVSDIRHDRLLHGKRPGVVEIERPIPKPHECPQCKFIIAPLLRDCPNCGYRSKRPCTVSVTQGELVAFEIAAQEKRAKKKQNGEWSWPEKAMFLSQLRGYADERCYREGWAANKYKSRFDVWPNDPRVKYAPALPCGPAVRSWIRAQQIKWAHRRQPETTNG